MKVRVSQKAHRKGAQVTEQQDASQRKGRGRHPEGQRPRHILKGTVDHLRKLLSQNAAHLGNQGGDQHHSRK